MSATTDRARATVQVSVSPDEAFDLFTREMDLWWRTGPAYRVAGKQRGRLTMELCEGGRLFETFETSTGTTHTFEMGRVRVWEPPHRLVFEWRGVNFKPDESTEVEVQFTAFGRGTRVTVEHRGWSALRDDHPVRHGESPDAFLRRMGMWWGGLLRALAEHCTMHDHPADKADTGSIKS